MPGRVLRFLYVPLLVGVLSACAACGMPPASEGVTRYTYEVVNTFPHDIGAFTQGLLYHEGFLYESTGLRGQSTLRKVALETGDVLRRHDLDPQFFGEGLALVDDRLIQLTWTSGIGFVYDLDTFAELGTFTFEPEGWGLTYDGKRLIKSNGTNILRFLDPDTFEVLGEVAVFDGIQPITRLNELAYINGRVYANVFQTNEIVIINPENGAVTGRIDLRGLAPAGVQAFRGDVLNGIAYDAENDRLFVTGKRWPSLFEIRLVPIAPR